MGIDVAAHIAKFLSEKLGERATSASGLGILNDLVKGGFTGRKSKKGVFIYEEGVKGSERPINSGFTEIIKKYSVPAKIK